MTGLETLIIPALLPAVADGVKTLASGVFGWITGSNSAQPKSVDETIKLMEAEVGKLKALSELDKPAENISSWVADLRASFRYIMAGIIIIFTMVGVSAFYILTYIDPTNVNIPVLLNVVDILVQLTGSVFSFIFGDRLYMSLKGIKK